MTTLLWVLLFMGLAELAVQVSQPRGWIWTLGASVLLLAATYPWALRVGWPLVQQQLLGEGKLVLVALVCVQAVLTLWLELSRPLSQVGEGLRWCWSRLASPLGLVALAVLQWQLFYRVDAVPYVLLSLGLGAIVALGLGMAAWLGLPEAGRSWLALGQLLAAIGMAVAAAAQEPLPRHGMELDAWAGLSWLLLIGICGGLGAAMASGLRWRSVRQNTRTH